MEKRPDDHIIDTILRDEVRKLNQHLPKQRKSIAELLKDESPQVTSIDGRTIRMQREEVERLASLLSNDLLDRVHLPIVLIRRRDMGLGAFAVLGDKPEAYAVTRMLGLAEGSFDEYKSQATPELVVYKPQVSELIRTYHSIVVMGFGVLEDLRSG